MNTEYKSLRIEKQAGITEIILIGPGKGNAMGPDFWREMPILFSELDRDDKTRAVIIRGENWRGEGGDFSYGLDLMAMAGDIGVGAQNPSAAERTRFLDKVGLMQQACDRVAVCRKPVIAAINGWCIGGGLDLISACDIRIASADAKFSLREAKIAIVADIGSLQRLPAIIGQGHTRELAYTGKDIDAARALRIGLVNDVYETPEAMLEAARNLAAEIAANPPLVVQGAKQVMNYCADKSIADGLQYVAVWNSAFMHSLDLVEAITAFRERRKPEFKGL